MAATPQSTRHYAERFPELEGHFREQQGLMMSSIGVGTYLGDADDETDERYRHAIVRAVGKGVNVLDTAINYRHQRSERSIARAIRDLTASGTATRDEIVVATKAGYVSFDSAPPANPREYFLNTFINSGVIGPRDLVAGCHCMTPRYFEHQMEQSLRNLGMHSIDVFYVHNPETQLAEISRDEFYKRLRVAFGFLEGAVQSGKIRMYGVATWNAYRVSPGAKDFVSLEDTVQCARDVAGDDHHFRVVQLPYNLAMPEAQTSANQKLEGKVMTALEAASHLGLTVMASATIFQSRLTRGLPAFVAEHLRGLKTDGQRAIQFVRSTPGLAVALVGMSQAKHVDENVAVAVAPPAAEQVARIFNAS